MKVETDIVDSLSITVQCTVHKLEIANNDQGKKRDDIPLRNYF